MTDDQSWHAPSGQTPAGHDPVPPAPAAAAVATPAPAPAPQGQAPYGQAPHGQAPYGQAPYGHTPSAHSVYGQAPFGQTPYGQASYGQSQGAQPAYAQPQYGYAAVPQQQPAWTPPPKPGLIPLRPLAFGTLLGAPFLTLRRNPKATFGSALIVQALTVLGTLLITGPITFLAIDRMDRASSSEFETVAIGSTAAVILSMLVPVLLSVLASALLQGVIVLEVARATVGEKLRLSTLWKAVFKRAWPLIGWIFLLIAGYTVGIAVVAGVVVLLAVQGPDFLGLTIGAGVILTLGLLALFAWLTVKTSLVPCLIVLEQRGIVDSIKRSWSLVRGYFWKALGIQLLVAFIVNMVSQIITAPIMMIYGFSTTLIDPNSALDSMWPAIISYLVMMLVSLIIGAVAIVAQSATVALIYIDLRMRKEGLDIELQRFVEAREMGASDVADPYLVAQSAPSAPTPYTA